MIRSWSAEISWTAGSAYQHACWKGEREGKIIDYDVNFMLQKHDLMRVRDEQHKLLINDYEKHDLMTND